MPEIDRERFRRLAEHAAREAVTVDDPDERADAAAFADIFSAAAAVRDIPHAETRPLLEAVDRLAKMIEETDHA